MVSNYQGKLQEPVRDTYPRVGEFMSRSFLEIRPDMEIYQAMALLLKHKVTGAAVVDDNKRLVGIISEKDCLKLVAHDAYDNVPRGGSVESYMTTKVVTLQPSSGLNEAAHIFINNPYKKLPVLDKGKLVGVVRRRDVLAVIQEFHKKRMNFINHIEF